MQRQTITANFIQAICWYNDAIIDWSSGEEYQLDGSKKQFGEHYGFGDSVIISACGTYVFIYKRLATKGLLLKNGKLVREINRSYYCAGSYEYPAAFVEVDSKTYLIHCPVAYKQLDFEDVETRELVTNITGRAPTDIFHSRLEISPDGAYLMSKGWIWHPLDRVELFDIKACLKNPLLLDDATLFPDVDVEVCTASFIDNNTVLLGTSDEYIDDEIVKERPLKSIMLWNFKTGYLSTPIKIKEEFGNLVAINSSKAWDLYRFPKIIDLSNGEIIEQDKSIDSGEQRSAIIDSRGTYLPVAINSKTKQLAIMGQERIEVLTPSV